MAKRILLADDSVTIQKVVELTLTEPDYVVTTVGSGDEALERIADEAPDLVIADVHMPGATGLEVATRMRESRAGLPVLLLVGAFEPFDPDEASASGAVGHLQKPFDAEELLALVQRWTADDGGSGGGGAGGSEPSTARAVGESGGEPEAASSAGELTLSDEQLETIARKVVAQLDPGLLRDIAWEVIPDMAEIVIKERLRELESQVDESPDS